MTDIDKIEVLASIMGAEIKRWGNGLVVKTWMKRFVFNDVGEIVKVQIARYRSDGKMLFKDIS